MNFISTSHINLLQDQEVAVVPTTTAPWRSYGRDGDWEMTMRGASAVIRASYPDGDLWLSRRLDDVEDGNGHAQIIAGGHQLQGLLIETPKPHGCIKLSTLWISPELRRTGLGTKILEARTASWVASGAPRVWITASAIARTQLEPLLSAHGFTLIACETDRYGRGRDEFVYQWTAPAS